MSTNTAAPEVWYAPDIQPRHDWMSVGAKVHAPDEKAQARILRAIAEIDTGPGEWSRWHRIPGEGEPPLTLAIMSGEAIKTTVREFKMPRVTHCGITNYCAPYGFYGIRAHYKKPDGTLHRVELFIMDEGVGVTPIVARVWP